MNKHSVKAYVAIIFFILAILLFVYSIYIMDLANSSQGNSIIIGLWCLAFGVINFGCVEYLIGTKRILVISGLLAALGVLVVSLIFGCIGGYKRDSSLEQQYEIPKLQDWNR